MEERRDERAVFEKIADVFICFEAILFAMTELLSIFRGLQPGIVGLCWGIVLCLLFIFKNRVLSKGIFSKERNIDIEKNLDKQKKSDKEKPREEPFHNRIKKRLSGRRDLGFNCLLVVLGLELVILLFMALLTVPYNWDSMTYHLARIAHWIQNASVAYYPTNIRRQLFSPVLAEYNLLHLMLLTGSDLLVNLLQYGALLISLLFLYAIQRQMRISKRVAVLCCIAFSAMPVVIGESLSTQVDLFAAALLLVTVYKIIHLADGDMSCFSLKMVRCIIITALGSGLCYLAKPNLCFALVILFLWMLICQLKKRAKPLVLAAYFVLALFIVALLLLPVFVRNISYTGDPFALVYMGSIVIGSFKPQALLLNIYKNMALCGIMPFNQSILLRMGSTLSRMLHMDINAAAVTYGDGSLLLENNLYFSFDHDYAAGGWFVTIFCLTFLLFLGKRLWSRVKNRRESIPSLFYFLWLQALVSLAVVRWQPWGNRLLLPSLALLVPALGVMLQELLSGKGTEEKEKSKGSSWAAQIWILTLALCFVSVGTLAIQYHMRYVDANLSGEKTKTELYCSKKLVADIYEKMAVVTEELGAQAVGIKSGGDSFVYPMWQLLKKNQTVRVEEIVDGQEIADYLPDCILVLDLDCERLEYGGYAYEKIWSQEDNGRYRVLVRCDG